MAGSVQRVWTAAGVALAAAAADVASRRRLDTIDVPFDELAARPVPPGARSTTPTSPAVCGALRLYHEHLGVPVDDLPLAIPISRRTDDDPAGGNRFTATRFAAPVGLADPVERMRRIHEIVLAGA